MSNHKMRGLVVLIVQLAILCSLGLKLLYDRRTRPHVWVQTAYFDPDLPIRGRYVALQCAVEWREQPQTEFPEYAYQKARLEVEGNRLVAIADSKGSVTIFRRKLPNGGYADAISEPLMVFLPEHANVPQIREHGRELWVDATIPRKGPPRPIRLGIKENGVITPVDIR